MIALSNLILILIICCWVGFLADVLRKKMTGNTSLTGLALGEVASIFIFGVLFFVSPSHISEEPVANMSLLFLPKMHTWIISLSAADVMGGIMILATIIIFSLSIVASIIISDNQ